MWTWLTRTLTTQTPTLPTQKFSLRLEELESREVPAVLIQVDYSRDTGFFANNAEARAVMERVASELGGQINANLSAITPSGGNTWTATFFDPATGGQFAVQNLAVGANTLRLYVGGRAIGGNEAGFGGFGGYSVSGSNAWLNTVQTRNWGGFAPWGGSITFDTNTRWHFGQTTAGLDSTELDFYSVALHELGHVLGIGTAGQWSSNVRGGSFVGANAQAVYGGPVPLSPDLAHWADGVVVNGQSVSLDPTLTRGTRVGLSALDIAALRDMGWSGTPVSPPAAPPASPPVAIRVPLANEQAVAFTGSTTGSVPLFTVSNGVLTDTGRRLTPFTGYAGAIRVAGGDFNGDGITDYAFTTGAGPQAVVQLMDGRNGNLLVGQTVIFQGFRGGLFLAAADIDRDGKAELVVSADAGAGPHIQTFRIVNGAMVLQSSFFSFDNPAFRGGARVAAGDLNRDGFADVVVTTGGQAEGRVAIYSGADLRHGVATRLFPDFVPFAGLWGGLNAAVGDMNGDGYAELAISPDRGGPAHVKVWSGSTLTAMAGVQASNIPLIGSFFAFAPNDPSGARLALRDTNGDGRAELITASGNRNNSLARVFSFEQMVSGGANAPTMTPFSSVVTFDGLYAGLHTSTTTATTETPDAIVETENPGNTVYTATSQAVAHKCTCAGCSVLAQLANGVSEPDDLLPAPIVV